MQKVTCQRVWHCRPTWDSSLRRRPTAGPPVKARFSAPPPADVGLSVFHPEPLFDAAWRAPIPATGRIPKAVPEGCTSAVTRLSIANAHTPSERAQLVAQYPFLKAGEAHGCDSSDSGPSGAFRSYSGREEAPEGAARGRRRMDRPQRSAVFPPEGGRHIRGRSQGRFSYHMSL
jgi:hypothetical protein